MDGRVNLLLVTVALLCRLLFIGLADPRWTFATVIAPQVLALEATDDGL